MPLPGVPFDWQHTPRDALAHWPADRPAVMLHSGRPHAQWARSTYLAEPTAALCFDGKHTRWIGPNPPTHDWQHHPFRDLLTALDADPDSLWVGYFSYDIARWIERLPETVIDDRDWPILQFQRCPGHLRHDTLTNTWTAHGSYTTHPPILETTPTARPFRAQPPTPSPEHRQRYTAAVRSAIDYIAAGDIFQVNLAQRFTAPFTGSPRALYQSLATGSPAWYGAYLEFLNDPDGHGESQRTICSTSPELFLDVAPTGRVVTRPIKGTRPADSHTEDLEYSSKDTAELAMIVDLMRNDLGRVCDVGSVRVEHARTIESHPTVHHGVATITGNLHHSAGIIDLLRATLPGGSVTGAPKVRAMQVIDELEPVRRGPYCGAIGFIQGGPHRPTAAFNIAIRTLLLDSDHTGQGHADFSVGAGIVADSDPECEYRETLDKAKAMLQALDTPPL